MSRLKRGGQLDSLSGFRADKKEPTIPSGLLRAARRSGQLDLSGRGLTEVPQDVYRLNMDTPQEAQQDVSFGTSDCWWEQTDLTKLILSSNQLTQLSDDIRLLAVLTTLDLHDNQLRSLPGALGELQELQQLRLSHNKLTSLPIEVCTLKNLCSITLQQNQLESLPDEMGQLEKLTHLDLSHNHLKGLPVSLGHLSCLQKLNVCHNELSCLPASLAQLTNVKLLDFSNNQLTDIPATLSEMPALEQLYLRHNKLRVLPKLVAPTLKELYVGNNRIEEMETELLTSLTAISVLELRDNKIKILPEEITSLNTLTRLDLTNNDITTGRIKGDPESAEEGQTAMTLPSQARVNVHNIKTLKSLAYSEKQAVDIPDELFDAATDQGVTTVNFSKNQLTSIPPRLIELSASLSDLNLAFNRLTCCSPDVCKFLQLMHMDLRNNQLTDLPSEMKNLNKLRSITLNYNRFKSFPGVLYQIVSLETVLIGNNQVGEVDAHRLKMLVNLSTLDMSNNDLLNIPPEVGLCASLRCLGLEGNPFRTPRAAILAKGTDAVLEYLRSRIPT
uniref:Leucine rich repeat containing 40 n=1 Tax=Gasterosteus aculeatus aculeatus TaxID=481459 RepID=G3NBF2_GASAC